jgi:hypothetical protein
MTRIRTTPATLALSGVVLGTLGIGAAYASAFFPHTLGKAGPYLMAVAVPVCLIATMVLGAARGSRALGALKWPILLVFVLVGGGFLLALLLPADTVHGPYWLGLPRRAAVVLYGVGLLPLFVLPLAYAFTFDALTLSDEDLARVRAARSHDARDDDARDDEPRDGEPRTESA